MGTNGPPEGMDGFRATLHDGGYVSGDKPDFYASLVPELNQCDCVFAIADVDDTSSMSTTMVLYTCPLRTANSSMPIFLTPLSEGRRYLSFR